MERKYRVELPEDLRQFWLDSDGAILWFEHKELQFFPVSDVIEDHYSVAGWMPGALPLCLDGGGNIGVARVAVGRIDGYFVAPSGDLDWGSSVKLSDDFFSLLRDSMSFEQRLREAGADA